MQKLIRTGSLRAVRFCVAFWPTLAFAGDDATFVGQTVRTVAAAGGTFEVSLTFHNSGDTTWVGTGTDPYRLGSWNPADNTVWSVGRVNLGASESIAPGYDKTFTFNVTAPSVEDVYDFQWKIVHENQSWVGQPSSNVEIDVTDDYSDDDCTLGYLGYDNTVGISSDLRFLCYHDQWYDCGWGSTAPWDEAAADQQIIGDYICIMGTYPQWYPASMDAELVSQAVPTTMAADGEYLVSVTMKNVGTVSWTSATNFRLGSQSPPDNETWGLGRVDLGSSEVISPNEDKTFTFTARAPSTPGTYAFSFKMLREGVAWFGDASTELAITVTAEADADCEHGYTGTHNTVGISSDERFLCFNNQWYDCGWDGSGAWDVPASHGQVIGDYVCVIDEYPAWLSCGVVSDNNICTQDLCSTSGIVSHEPIDDPPCYEGCLGTTCALEGAACGEIPNGCGGTISCGSCDAGEVCQ